MERLTPGRYTGWVLVLSSPKGSDLGSIILFLLGCAEPRAARVQQGLYPPPQSQEPANGENPPMQKSGFDDQCELERQLTTGDLTIVYPGRHLYVKLVPTA